MADTINLNGTAPTEDTGETPPRTTPPKPRAKPKTTASKATADDATRRTPADRKLASSVAEMYTMMGMVIAGIGEVKQDPGVHGTGVALMSQGEAIAETWMDLADKNPKVKNALKTFTEVSAVGAVVGIHVTCAMPLLASRGVVPAFMMGAATEGEH